MIMDDDVLFHAHTRVETLLGHLQRVPDLGLVAACYHPDVCYAHNFTLNGRHVTTEPVPPHPSSTGQSGCGDRGQCYELTRAQMVQNLFVARSRVLRAHPWDERQQLMEHETFYFGLADARVGVGFDASVTAVHQRISRSTSYDDRRHTEHIYLQYLCRNFPRLSTWVMPCAPPEHVLQLMLRMPPHHLAAEFLLCTRRLDAGL